MRMKINNYNIRIIRSNRKTMALEITKDAEIMDYVVVHELCHRKEMNHSAAFWAEVEKILPDYRERRRWLKEHGGAIIARMGGTNG